MHNEKYGRIIIDNNKKIQAKTNDRITYNKKKNIQTKNIFLFLFSKREKYFPFFNRN